ncbi:MAG: hypothetical protein AB8H03_08095, partial [Saprospiraceae bacterium]
FLLGIIFLQVNCSKNEEPNNLKSNQKGIILGSIDFEDEFGHHIAMPFPVVEVTLEKDGIVNSTNSDSIGNFKFKNLDLGIYQAKVISAEYGTCKKPFLEINEENPQNGIYFDLKRIPTSKFTSIQIDSFVNNRDVYYSAFITPLTGKPLAIRLYYGDDRNVDVNNYIYTREGGGWMFVDSLVTNDLHKYFDRLDLNNYSSNSDSIFIAAYVAAAGYEKCYNPVTEQNEFSPVSEIPVILAIKK